MGLTLTVIAPSGVAVPISAAVIAFLTLSLRRTIRTDCATVSRVCLAVLGTGVTAARLGPLVAALTLVRVIFILSGVARLTLPPILAWACFGFATIIAAVVFSARVRGFPAPDRPPHQPGW